MSIVTRLATGRRRVRRPVVAAVPKPEVPVWDCLHCGVKAIAASLKGCPGCQRDRSEKPAVVPVAVPVAPKPPVAEVVKPAEAAAKPDDGDK